MVIINPVPLPPYGGQPYTNITPFTYRDGWTFQRVLEELRKYIRDVLVPHVDDSFDALEAYVNQAIDEQTSWTQATVNQMVEFVNTTVASLTASVDGKIDDLTIYVNGEVTDLTTYVNSQVQLIIEDSIQVQDPVMAGILGDPVSQSRSVADLIYADKETQTTVNSGRLENVNVVDSGGVTTDGNNVEIGSTGNIPDYVGTSSIVGAGAPNYENIIGGIIDNVNTPVSNVPVGGAGTGDQTLVAPNGNWNNVAGGYDNVVNGWACQIHGYHCKVNVDANHVTIAGGSIHIIDAGIAYPTIGGGTNNHGSGNAVTIAGGSNNHATGNYSTIGGGQDNNSLGSAATIVGGTANSAEGSQASVGGGLNNVASGISATIAGGQNNVSSGVAAFATGRENLASGAAASAMGRESVADLYASYSHSSGQFSSKGDAQYQRVILRRQTTDATPSVLFLDGVALQMILTPATTWAFSIIVVARRTDAADESAAYKFEGVVDRNAVTSIVGTPVKTVMGEDTIAWDCNVSAGSGALQITATGEAAKTIRWVATVDIVKVA